MISTSWLKRRKPQWERLESLLKLSDQRSLKSLSRAELQELTLLYRQTAADLSTLREDVSGRQLAEHVNRLLGRAHNTIYFGERGRLSAIWKFYRNDYPALFRRNLRLFVIAVCLFSAGGLAGMVVTLLHPDFPVRIIGPEMVRKIEHREMWTNSVVAIKPLASSGIATNNLTVSFITFAYGITGGVLTVWMLVFNGLLMGVIGTACHNSGMSLSLWSFVVPHGSLELPAIFIAGAAGMRIAQGLLFPGTLPRRLSLARCGNEAVRLLLGVIPMLLVAGTIEGFFSPTDVPVTLKFGMGAATFIVLALYLFSRPVVAKADSSL
jgi:uncharacterized membrane protein SpoIIM required for sporulation